MYHKKVFSVTIQSQTHYTNKLKQYLQTSNGSMQRMRILVNNQTEGNKKRILSIALVFLFAVFASNVFGQINYSISLDSFMDAEVDINHFNGNVLVAKQGIIIYEKSFGYRNYDTKKFLDANSVFELASISKQFTALGILQLIEKGKLKLSDTLRKFFPELPYNNITIQNLLTHTSGLPDYGHALATKWNHKKIAFNNDIIKFLATEKIPVNFKPGEKWEYCNTAFEMLASIIEKISGISYNEYMQKNIFNPLGMRHSMVYNTRRSSKKIIPDYAYGFVYSDSLKKYILPDSLPEYDFVVYSDGIEGDGCVNSTTGDLLKWDRAIKNHTLLKRATQEAMLSSQSLMDTASKTYYGYGEMLGRNEIGNYITHAGGWPGYGTLLTRYIEADITIIILSNNEFNPTSLAGDIAYIATNKEVTIPYHHIEVAVDSSILNKYTGKYLIPNEPRPAKIALSKKEGKLFYQFENGSTETELMPESPTKFFNNKGADMQIEFEMDSKGNPIKAFAIFSGMKKQMRKINE